MQETDDQRGLIKAGRHINLWQLLRSIKLSIKLNKFHKIADLTGSGRSLVFIEIAGREIRLRRSLLYLSSYPSSAPPVSTGAPAPVKD